MSRRRTQITPLQFALTIYPITVGTVYFPAAGVVVPLAGSAGWLAVLLAFAVGLLFTFLAVQLCRLAPVGDFAAAVKAWAGPWLGRLLLAYFLAIGIWLGSLLLVQGSLVFHAVALPATPPLALTVSSLLLLMATDLLGVEVYMRTVQLLLFLFSPLLASMLLGILPLANLSNLLPWLGTGPSGILHGAYLSLPWVMEGVIFTLFLGCLVKQQQSLHKYALLPIALAGLSLSGLVLLSVAELGQGVVARLVYPSVQLAMSASLGNFMQGLELFFYPLWLVTSYVKSTACFLLASESLRGLWPGLKQPWRTGLLGAVYFGISFLPRNILGLVAAISRVDNSLVAAFYWLLPPLLWLAWWRQRRHA